MTASEYHRHAGPFTWEGHGPSYRLVDFAPHLSSDLHHYSLSQPSHPPPTTTNMLHFTPVADQPPQRPHISTLKSCKYSTSKRQQEHTPSQRPSAAVAGTVTGYQHFMNNDRQERSKFVEKLIGE